jgi:Ethanolamine utilization protein EutJ (predicted chaperonin)
MEGFGFFNDPDFQKRLQDMAEQMQSQQSLAWADNAIKLAVDMTVAAINRMNLQGTPEQQAQQVRAVMATIFPEAVTLVREARAGLSYAFAGSCASSRAARPAAMTSLKERKRKMNTIAAKPSPNMKAAIAICCPTE